MQYMQYYNIYTIYTTYIIYMLYCNGGHHIYYILALCFMYLFYLHIVTAHHISIRLFVYLHHIEGSFDKRKDILRTPKSVSCEVSHRGELMDVLLVTLYHLMPA